MLVLYYFLNLKSKASHLFLMVASSLSILWCFTIINFWLFIGGQYEQLHQRVNRTVLKSQNLERKGLGIAKLSLLKKKATETYAPLAKGQEAHWEVVQRILFLYAKLNPGQSYVQGMNEIIGPIYYVFASDPNNEWKGNVLLIYIRSFPNNCSYCQGVPLHSIWKSSKIDWFYKIKNQNIFLLHVSNFFPWKVFEEKKRTLRRKLFEKIR